MRDQQRKALADEILDLVTTGAAADGRQSSQGGRIDREESDSSSASEGEDAVPQRKLSTGRKGARLTARQKEEEEFFSDGYDADFYGDEEDRKRLAAMTEVEREARQAKIERRELEEKMRNRELQQQSSGRTARGPSTEAERKRKRLDELKAKRENKRRQPKKSLLEDSDSDYNEESVNHSSEEGEVGSEEEEEDTDYEEESKREDATRESKGRLVEDSLIDFELANALRLSRDQIEKWIFHPQFDELARGHLVRLSVGMRDGQPVYRLAEIRRIVPYHRTYRLSSHTTAVKKAAVLRHGKSERTFCLDICSNSPFTPREFSRWWETMKQEGQVVPPRRIVEQRIKAWKSLETEPISDRIVAAMVEAKRTLGLSRRNLLAERTVLLGQLTEHQQAGNIEELQRIRTDLEALEVEIEREKASRPPEKTLDALIAINKRNRQANLRQAKEAMEEERLRNGKTETPVDDLDPFSRRKCQPSHMHIVGGDDDGNEEVIVEIEEERELEPHDSPINSPKHDMFSAHNVDIDIDL